MSTSAQSQAATLEKFIDGWKKWTFEDWSAAWSPDFTQKVLPLTLGVPSKSKEEVSRLLPALMATLSNYELNIREVVNDVESHKAAIYVTSKADTPFEDGFKWTNEYAVFLSFTEDGKEIKKLEEMVDTAFYLDFFPRFQRYMGARGAM